MTTLVDEIKLIPGRVTTGLAWFEENYPGFRERINKEELNMADPFYCLFGQLDYPNGWAEFAKHTDYSTWVNIGILPPLHVRINDRADVKYYRALTKAWKEVL